MPSPVLSLLSAPVAQQIKKEADAIRLTPEAYLNCLAAAVSGLTFGEILENVIEDIRAEAAMG